MCANTCVRLLCTNADALALSFGAQRCWCGRCCPGWCHDGDHYTTSCLLTRFLNATFGVHPRIAWQLDPFGHSATHASLLCSALGFEALIFGRADYQDMAYRAVRRQLELLWRSSDSWGEAATLFTHNYATGELSCRLVGRQAGRQAGGREAGEVAWGSLGCSPAFHAPHIGLCACRILLRSGRVWFGYTGREGGKVFLHVCVCVYGNKHHQMFSKSVQIMPQEIMAHPQDSTLIGALPTLSP